MDNLWYYRAVFRRRLPWFLLISSVISAAAVIVAYSLPPAYVSRMVLLVEAPQIPENLAPSTVSIPAFEQLQIIEQRLMTRENMLDIARQLNVLPNLDEMNADEIVNAMRARTSIRTSPARRDEAPVMTISFEAPAARTAAGVLNEYLVLIQQQDSELRRGRAGETLEFFEQEVARLSEELERQSAEILTYKQANTGALPDSLEPRLDQQARLQERQLQFQREMADLAGQKDRLIQLYDVTGAVDTNQALPRSPEQAQLAELRAELDAALSIYSEENPRVRILRSRVETLEARIAATALLPEGEAEAPEPETPTLPPVLVLQLSEIDSRIAVLREQSAAIDTQLTALAASIARTPEVAVALEEMERRYAGLEGQYALAEDRLSRARTGERIETRARGQRLSVIEQPAIPSQPSKPNRVRLAGAGVMLGIGAGMGLLVLLEMLNTTARRPEDIINRLGITPLTTIPYIHTRGQRFWRRGLQVGLALVILVGVPLAVYAVHVYYLPLDLLAEKVMNRLGVRL